MSETYACPFAVCEDGLSALALSGHMRKHAGVLEDGYRRAYAEAGLLDHMTVVAVECTARVALAYRAVTGSLPRWAPAEVDAYAEPDWDTL